MLVKHAGRHYALKTLHKAQIMEMGLQARPTPAVGAPALHSVARGAPRHAAASAVHGGWAFGACEACVWGVRGSRW